MRDDVRQTFKASDAHGIVGHRYIGQPCPSGARIDICCQACQHRIVLGPESIREIETRNAPHLCHECFFNMASDGALRYLVQQPKGE